ncbi:MAG: hypothetical protein WC627_06055 [Legionella sp.]|jgi:hypothetical protein
MEPLITAENLNVTETNKLQDVDLHSQANKSFGEAHYLVFQVLPALMEQIIEQQLWKEKDYNNFGEYALEKSSDGLSICNNDRLLLLKCALEINGRHALEWGDVLNEVESSVRVYAKEKNIPIKEFSKSLHETEATHPDHNGDKAITYLPSRSKSNDGQLLRLRKKDEQVYEKVVQGEIKLKDAFPPRPKKRLEPIESAKDKFINLSKPDQLAFLAWIEQQKRDISAI